MKQMTFAGAKGFAVHGRATRKAEFLARMDALVPWAEFCALIEPHYPRAGNGRPPLGVERMLRMYLLANWFNLSDEACEDALYDMPAFRDFCRIDLGRERAPDATTLLRFRHLLEEQQIGAALFSKVGELLLAQGMKLSGGTIVDATLIAAPSSTKNEKQERDPEMQQTKKGNQWYFGMKVHIGVDSQSGLVHSASVTAANVHDSQQLPNLLHGEERRLYGDSAYRGKNQREQLKRIAPRQGLHQQACAPAPRAEPKRSANQPQKIGCAGESRTSVSDPQADVGVYESTLSRLGEERQPCRQQMGESSYGRGVDCVSKRRKMDAYLAS